MFDYSIDDVLNWIIAISVVVVFVIGGLEYAQRSNRSSNIAGAGVHSRGGAHDDTES